MKTIKTLVIGLLMSVSMVSCHTEESVDVNQDKIFTEYELFYDANEDKTYAKAKFKFSNSTGTTLKLTSPSAVYFDDDVLHYNETFAIYEKVYAGYKGEGSFKYKNADGKTYVNSISNNPIQFPVITEIDSESSFELEWEGTPLISKENVVLILMGKNGGTEFVLKEGAGVSSIIIPKNQLQKLQKGETDMFMDRTWSPDLQQKNDAGGTIIGKYRALNKKVNLN
ncbi:MAG: hypothetical protein ACK4ND_01535 [Cytophagaceae bacterium]